jgi:hypothetical protein
VTTLPRTASCLRRLLGGQGNAFARHVLKQTAERHARKPGATPEAVVAAIRSQHSTRLFEKQYEQLLLALEVDLAPGGAA